MQKLAPHHFQKTITNTAEQATTLLNSLKDAPQPLRQIYMASIFVNLVKDHGFCMMEEMFRTFDSAARLAAAEMFVETKMDKNALEGLNAYETIVAITDKYIQTLNARRSFGNLGLAEGVAVPNERELFRALIIETIENCAEQNLGCSDLLTENSTLSAGVAQHVEAFAVMPSSKDSSYHSAKLKLSGR